MGLGAIGATADGLIEDFALSALGGMMGAFGIGFDLGVFISQQFPYPSTTGDQSCHDYLDLVAESPGCVGSRSGTTRVRGLTNVPRLRPNAWGSIALGAGFAIASFGPISQPAVHLTADLAGVVLLIVGVMMFQRT